MFTAFDTAEIEYFKAHPRFGAAGTDTLPRSGFDRAEAEITAWDGYEPTALFSLAPLAKALDVGAVYYKHEGPRFGLGSFKALGGAYAVLCILQRELEKQLGHPVSAKDIRDGVYAQAAARITVISATDGNHGRSVAWGAARFGTRCRIYIHAEVSEFRAQVMRDLGAEVIRIDGDYDASVAQTREDAEANGWLIVSDTSWPGYYLPPLDVLSGYGVMAREIVRYLTEAPTHVFLQGGVGGLAAAVAAVFCQEWGEDATQVIVVEPELAPCLYESARADQLTAVDIQSETIMAGLSCGEPSEIAWSVLAEVGQGFMTIPDGLVPPVVRSLANGAFGDGSIEAGESAVAGLAGLIAAARKPSCRQSMGLTPASRIVVIGSEGVTDPEVYAAIMKGAI